jgi:hypothetical protein
MPDGLAEDIEEGKIAPKTEPKLRSRALQDEYNWD